MTSELNNPGVADRGVSFAPVLTICNGVTDIDFYKKAFGAVEHMRVNNEDGSVHVAEFFIEGAMFHLHEVTRDKEKNCPDKLHLTTVTIGLMTPDVHSVFNTAIAAGAVSVSPVTDYEYGYRQGELRDPFGHHWVIECRIPPSPDWKP